jgi:hypothetical protein
MKHLKSISSARPATAQVQVWLDILSLITATLSVIVQVTNIFGIDLNKGDDEEIEA